MRILAVPYRQTFSRIAALAAASSLLAACGGGSPGAPPFPARPGLNAQSLVRDAAGAKHTSSSSSARIAATPASLEFTDAQAKAATPQTVTITAQTGETLALAITGSGNCPTVTPAQVQPRRDGGPHGSKSATITVTPNGDGPSTCTLTVSTRGEGDSDEHGAGDDGGDPVVLTIPVTVDAPPLPFPCRLASC